LNLERYKCDVASGVDHVQDAENIDPTMTVLRKRLNAVMVRQVGQELLLLDTASNQIHQLNQTASFIWQKCDEGRSSEEMARLLATAYEISYSVAVTDVVQTLERLRELNLIVEVDSSEQLRTQASAARSESDQRGGHR
jgi:hypothetical protein